MCGIVGYVGPKRRDAAAHRGLKRLEYRGYDSAGVVDHERQGRRDAEGARERSRSSRRRCAASPVDGNVGIAHTRWATHGAPNECNAHPHPDCTGTIAVVHNGIIENYDALRADAREARPHVRVGDRHRSARAPHRGSVRRQPRGRGHRRALRRSRARTASRSISSEDPDKIVAARKGSPLLSASATASTSSPATSSAILAHTRQVVYLDDGEMAVLTRDGYQRHRPRRAAASTKEVSTIDWDLDADREGRLRPLHAQGDLRAAADDREHDARPPPRRRGHRRSSAA